jgi:hypothetical protein
LTALPRILLATLVAGTLDILAAIGLTLAYGRNPYAMLRYVASGPFPQASGMGTKGAILGLVVHFALMAIIAAAYVLTADRIAALKSKPVAAGIAYGLVTYVAMNLIAVPARFGTFPQNPVGIATQLACHILLVGIPIALVARRGTR